MEYLYRVLGHIFLAVSRVSVFTIQELFLLVERVMNGTPCAMEKRAFDFKASAEDCPDLIVEREITKKLRKDNQVLSDRLQTSIAESFDWQAQFLAQQGNIEQIAELLDAMKVNYRKTLEDSRVFDVDHLCTDFENILKGRMFETCVALYMTKTSGFKLINWTPDKGVLSDLRVEANLHPDLLIEDKIKQPIFVECKFKGSGAIVDIKKLKMKQAITWAKVYQADRYERISREQKIPCWVAIGLKGNAASPDRVFLVPLPELQANSKTWEIYGEKDDQRACSLSWLAQWEISLDVRYDFSAFQGREPLRGHEYS